MLRDAIHGGRDLVATGCALAEARQVVDCGDEPCEALVVLRACLPAIGGVVGRGPDLVGLEAGKEIAGTGHDAEVRAVELVRRTEQDVGAERREFDRAVWRQMHRIGDRQGADAVGATDDLGRGRDGTDRVRRERERNDLRAGRDPGVERLEVEGAIAGLDAGVLGGDQPRRHVRVVVEHRDDDLVSRSEDAPDCAR